VAALRLRYRLRRLHVGVERLVARPFPLVQPTASGGDSQAVPANSSALLDQATPAVVAQAEPGAPADAGVLTVAPSRPASLAA